MSQDKAQSEPPLTERPKADDTMTEPVSAWNREPREWRERIEELEQHVETLIHRVVHLVSRTTGEQIRLLRAQRCEYGHACACEFDDAGTDIFQISSGCCVHGEDDCLPSLDHRSSPSAQPGPEPSNEQQPTMQQMYEQTENDPRRTVLTDFAAWLTTQPGTLEVGASHSSPAVLEAALRYMLDRAPEPQQELAEAAMSVALRRADHFMLALQEIAERGYTGASYVASRALRHAPPSFSLRPSQPEPKP